MIMMGMPDDTSVLAAIGKIAIRHGQLEHSLKMAVKTFSDVSIEEAIDATARQGGRDLRERVRKLARSRLGEGVALVKLDAILQRAQRATDERNALLHCLWGVELDAGPVMRLEGKPFASIPSTETLEALAETLKQIASDLNIARLDGFLRVALADRAA
jgi:hypothetical protein